LNTVGFGGAFGGSPVRTNAVPFGIVNDPEAETEGGAKETLVEVPQAPPPDELSPMKFSISRRLATWKYESL
jgi:hypothetical protein